MSRNGKLIKKKNIASKNIYDDWDIYSCNNHHPPPHSLLKLKNFNMLGSSPNYG